MPQLLQCTSKWYSDFFATSVCNFIYVNAYYSLYYYGNFDILVWLDLYYNLHVIYNSQNIKTVKVVHIKTKVWVRILCNLKGPPQKMASHFVFIVSHISAISTLDLNIGICRTKNCRHCWEQRLWMCTHRWEWAGEVSPTWATRSF